MREGWPPPSVPHPLQPLRCTGHPGVIEVVAARRGLAAAASGQPLPACVAPRRHRRTVVGWPDPATRTPAPAHCSCTRPPTARWRGCGCLAGSSLRHSSGCWLSSPPNTAAEHWNSPPAAAFNCGRCAIPMRWPRPSLPPDCCHRPPMNGCAISWLPRCRADSAVSAIPAAGSPNWTGPSSPIPAFAALPGRFWFSIDDGRGDVSGLRADVGVQLVDEFSIALLLAGVDTGVRLPAADAVDTMTTVARRFQDIRGKNWRISELDDHSRAASRFYAVGTDGCHTDSIDASTGGLDRAERRPSELGRRGTAGCAAIADRGVPGRHRDFIGHHALALGVCLRSR